MSVRPRYIALLLFVALTLVLIPLSAYSATAFGEITIVDEQIVRSNGRVVDFSVYKPANPTYGQPMPVVLTIHGISGSREAMASFNIELARRNFTVVSVDLAGHGVSSERFGFSEFFDAVEDAYEAVRYVQQTDLDTSTSTWGVLGHSLGAGISLLMQTMPIEPNSTVIIGGGMGQDFGGLELPLNTTNPRNLLIASGIWDELVTPEVAYDTLRIATGLSDVTEGTIYGDFELGTARKLALSPTNHLFEMTDSEIVTDSVDWLVRALQGEEQLNERTLDPSSHVYQISSLIGTILTVSFVMTLFPFLLILYSFIPRNFRPVRLVMNEPHAGALGDIKSSLLIGLVGSILLLISTLLGFISEFGSLVIVRVSFGTTLTLYSIFSFIVTYLLLKWRLTGFSLSIERSHLSDFFKSLLLVLMIVLWLVTWAVVAFFSGVELGFTPQIFTNSSLERAFYIIILTISFFPLYYGEFLWLNSVFGLNRTWKSLVPLAKDCIIALTHRLSGLGLLLALLYIPFLLNVQLGFIMFIALLLLVFTAFLGLGSLITLWVGCISRNGVLSSLLNALILAVLIAGTFQLL